MSEYCIVTTIYRNTKAIKLALEEMGYEYEEHTKSQHLHGYLGDRRDQTANIIVRKQNVGPGANDIGFAKRSDGTYELIISEYDMLDNQTQAEDFLHRIKRLYAKHATTIESRKLGFRLYSKQELPGDKIKIVVRH